MSKAAELAALIGSQSALSNRNMIINGAMQVAQRGTSFTNTIETYGADRINAYATNMGTFDVSQSTDAPDGFAKSFKFVCNTADASPASTDETVVQYKIEGQDLQQLGYGTSSAKTITVSFYVRSSETGDFGLWLYNEDGARQAASSYSINTANTWERKELTFAGDTSNGFNDDTGVGVYLRWYLGSGSAFIGSLSSTWSSSTNRVPTGGVNIQGSANRNWYITGIQLEVGEQATPFEHRSFAEEWDRCQRYCTVYNVGGGNVHPQNLVSPNHTVPGAAGHVDIANRAEWFLTYPVKRSQPTITVTDPTNMRWIANGNVVVDGNSSVTFPVGTGHQNATVFQGVPSSISTSSVSEGWVYKGGGTNPVITIDAEL